MSFAEILEELPSLTPEERRLLVERASALDEQLLSSEEEAMIEARLAEHDRDPSTAIPASELFRRLEARFGQ